MMLKKVSVDEHFLPYVPTVFPPATAADDANSAMVKRDMLRDRIRFKQMHCKKVAKQAKRDRIETEVSELIHSFLNDMNKPRRTYYIGEHTV